MTKEFSDLTGKILIATPFSMEGNVFHESLIYVIKHTSEGSIGLIFNRPLRQAPAQSLFSKDQQENVNLKDLELRIHVGGPVEVERGFFLHSNDYDKNVLFKPSQGSLAISSNIGILEDIASGSGPKDNIFIIGYTGWASGQLDYEIENNLWIASDVDHDLIFSSDTDDKWLKALNTAGVHSDYFVPIQASC